VIGDVSATMRIDAESRYDALDLLRRLSSHHTYLVQLGERHWSVCVRPDGNAETLAGEVLRTAREWALARGVESELRVANRRYTLGARASVEH